MLMFFLVTRTPATLSSPSSLSQNDLTLVQTSFRLPLGSLTIFGSELAMVYSKSVKLLPQKNPNRHHPPLRLILPRSAAILLTSRSRYTIQTSPRRSPNFTASFAFLSSVLKLSLRLLLTSHIQYQSLRSSSSSTPSAELISTTLIDQNVPRGFMTRRCEKKSFSIMR